MARRLERSRPCEGPDRDRADGVGNLSNVRPVGTGVSEYRIDFGPGYRIYFGRDGDAVIILLAGGTKHRQQRDIEAAKVLWREYRQRKRREG
jgi:putative addiction module killer protein